MEYVLKNLTDKPIRCEVINVVIPAKGRMPRPLQVSEKNILDTCGITYDGLLLEPVLMEAGSSGLANDETGSSGSAGDDAGSSEPGSDGTPAAKRAGRKPRGE